MPLSDPSPRRKLHTRAITIEGYQREDGLFDIEASLADTKTYDFDNRWRPSGKIAAGEKLHGMLMRLTIDEQMNVVSAEADTEWSPYTICPTITPNFARLAGLRIGAGWNRAVKERVGGVHGCTHLVELLAQMATVAFQTLTVIRRRSIAVADPSGRPPALLDTCHAYASDGEIVRERWPGFFTGPSASQDSDDQSPSPGAAISAGR